MEDVLLTRSRPSRGAAGGGPQGREGGGERSDAWAFPAGELGAAAVCRNVVRQMEGQQGRWGRHFWGGGLEAALSLSGELSCAQSSSKCPVLRSSLIMRSGVHF